MHQVLESVTLILSAQKPEGGVGRVEVREAMFWVFWCCFVGCLVVEGVVLALGVWVFGLEVMTDSGRASTNNYSPTIQTITNPNGSKVKTHAMQNIYNNQHRLTVRSPLISNIPKLT